MRWIKVVLFLSLFLASCGASATEPTVVLPTQTRIVGGLMPTFTPVASGELLPTKTAVFTNDGIADPIITSDSTPVPTPSNETIVRLRYAMPAIGLGRTLEGTADGQISIYDEVSERTASGGQRGNILAELIPALSATTLEPMDDCPTCLFLSYELPLAGETREGWLRDPRLAASLENYLAIALGPHFPAETIIGLRRSASSYAPAHSLALTANGRLFQWSATEDRFIEDETDTFAATELQSTLNRLPLARLQDGYVVDCALSPNELLYLRVGETSHAVQIVCPEFSLPDALLPLYLQLDDLMIAKLGDAYTPPSAAFPLSSLIDYQRAEDGARLTLLLDGSAIISTAALTETAVITGTIPATELRSLQLDLLATGVLTTGLKTFQLDPAAETLENPSRLLVRGEEGVYDAMWEILPEPAPFTTLNELLNRFLLPKPDQE